MADFGHSVNLAIINQSGGYIERWYSARPTDDGCRLGLGGQLVADLILAEHYMTIRQAGQILVSYNM